MVTIVLDKTYKKPNGRWAYGDKRTIKMNNDSEGKDLVKTIYQDFIHDGYVCEWFTLKEIMKFDYRDLMIPLRKADRQCDMFIMFD